MRVLFVPGLACRREIWDAAAAHLPGVEPVLVDWPWPEELDTVDAAAAWLHREAARHAVDAVVGHSLGGFVALHLYGVLARRPVPRLVAVDTFLADPHPVFRNHLWQAPPALVARVTAMLEEERPRSPRLREAATSFRETPAWVEAAMRTGAGFVYGGRGGDRSVAELARLAGIPAGAANPVEVVPGTSHFLMLERPGAFYAALRRALELR